MTNTNKTELTTKTPLENNGVFSDAEKNNSSGDNHCEHNDSKHSILWFRNDLRIHDNPALLYFIEQLKKANTQGHAVFFITPKQWQQHDVAAIKIDFILRHVAFLKEQLLSLGIALQVIDVDDFEAQISFFTDLTKQTPALNVIANSEVEYNEQQRDIALVKQGVDLKLFEADVIVPKGKLLNQSGTMFKVFTPFKKAWLTYVKQFGFQYLNKLVLSDEVNNINTIGASHSAVPDQSVDIEQYVNQRSNNWPLADVVEQSVIPNFISDKLEDYQDYRDIPSIKGTSGLSPYLAIGAISPRYLLTLLINNNPDILNSYDNKNFTWLNEIIWREFYRHLLFHFPKLCKHKSFNEKYQATRWHNNPELFKAWCEGKTGYPIVDAAMLQLNQTGWMHNRLRMIVASFLTKHLLVDWRWGEKYFMENLIDGDLAANNGGWQWAASTGCDAQPYFRIFNPIRQSERFDPDGTFIRKYLSELAEIPAKEIHFPHTYLAKNNLTCYWPAVVEHKKARELALAFYKT